MKQASVLAEFGCAGRGERRGRQRRAGRGNIGCEQVASSHPTTQPGAPAQARQYPPS